MKNLLIFIGLFAFTALGAQVPADSVVMTVAGKQISLSEFLFIAKKNGEVDLSNRKSVKKYVELFKNFKLKVAEAESIGLDKTSSFKKELGGYSSQLINSYLSDKEAEKAAVREVYDKGAETLELSHIVFRFPAQIVSKDTVAIYKQALDTYERLKKGEDIAVVGKELSSKDANHISYEYVPNFIPMQTVKAFEVAAYNLPVGEVSLPIRTNMGFHLIKVHRRKPNPGQVHVAHILIAFPTDTAVKDTTEIREKIQDVYTQLQAGADFAELAKKYSTDKYSAENGGILPWFGPGEMVVPFEQAAFALKNPGDFSKVVKSPFGYHIIKLIEKRDRLPFEKEYARLYSLMEKGERNFDIYKSFDDRLKKEYGYVAYPEAYAELQVLCDEYFPSSKEFFAKAKSLKKTLIHLNDTDFPQDEFAYYIQSCPFSTKKYSGDFMAEIYNLFLRDIVTTAERKNLFTKHPEISHLLQEYRDGILLFEISNRTIWNQPKKEQKALEAKWIKELNKKYPVSINWKLLKSIKN